MSDTGWKSPGTVVSDNAVGIKTWSNPSNAKVSDNNYANILWNPLGLLWDYTVKLVDESGSVVGDNKSNVTELDSSDTYRVYGGSSDDWGGTWSDTDINDSDFGVVFQITEDDLGTPWIFSEYLKATNFGFSIPSGATIDGIEVRVEQKVHIVEDSDPPPPEEPVEGYTEAHVDHIQIRVYYTEEGGKHYSRESDNTLGTDDSNLATIFSEQEYTDVGTDNDTYVDLVGTQQYFEFLFKEPNDNSTDSFRITWKGKSSVAPSSYPVYLQIYNRTTTSWTTLTSNNSASANTKFTLTHDITTSMSDYYDANHVISARVYQDIT